MGRNQIYCCICGAPILETGQSNDKRGEWLAHAVLLTTGQEKGNAVEVDTYWPQPPGQAYALNLGPKPAAESQRRVLQLDAEYYEHNRFNILGSDTTVGAFTVGTDLPTPAVTSGGSFYLAVHRSCNQLASHFIDSRPEAHDTFQISPQEEITSVKQLWELLEENPLDIPDLTESILQNLRAESSEMSKGKSDEMHGNLQGSDQISNAVRNQDWWYGALVNKKLFPWLWDLDMEAVHEKYRCGSWDWELIVRQLSQLEIHEPGDGTLSLPVGLRNRRRIWRLLEDARLDDIANDATVPRP
ncbi:hypothetical protein Hte_000005 [Hypoxylon texense]